MPELVENHRPPPPPLAINNEQSLIGHVWRKHVKFFFGLKKKI